MVGSVLHNLGDSLSRHLRRSDADTPYLSYHDVRLTQGDVNSLKDDWLTDTVISFWEEYLEREHLIHFRHAKVVLLRPSMAFMLIMSQNPLELREFLPDFTRVTHIFLPINDNRNPAVSGGGTHWSLLVVSVVDGVAFHYDSLHPANKDEAISTTRKLGTLLNKELRFLDLPDSPRQENGYDCGVFVCMEMKHLLLKKLLMAHSQEKIDMSMGGKAVDAARARKDMLRVMDGFRKEGEQRRS